MKGDLTREEIEIYGEMLDNQDIRDFVGIIKNNPEEYELNEKGWLVITTRLGAIRFIKTFEETLIKEAKSYINKEDGRD